MCGISGTVGAVDHQMIGRMNQAMDHRGPDDSGVYTNKENRVALGHVRLSIIETGALGHQPMTYTSGRYVISFNGEIYNYQQLRKELKKLGCKFSTHSDTEVVLAAYSQWGQDCVHKLDGMFAFAIHDTSVDGAGKSALFLARDRFGIKPIYYTVQNGVFCFASEIKGILASGLIRPKVNHNALCHYQVQGSVPQPLTMLEGVWMLKAGHSMTVDNNLEISINQYWDIAEQGHRLAESRSKMSSHEIGSEVRRLLTEATRRHLVADVPIGAFLSGGIDSSAVVALMGRETRREINTYSIGFTTASGKKDELEWASLVSKHLSTSHTQLTISEQDIFNSYSDIIKAIDQPSVDGTNTFLVSKLVGNEVKVVLSGLGGDELFAGYPHFSILSNLDRWDQYSAWMHPVVRKVLLRVLPGSLLPDKSMAMMSRLQRLVSLRNLSRYQELPDNMADGINMDDSEEALTQFFKQYLKPGLDSISSTSCFEVNNYLVNTLLRDVDATAMYNSLEVRPVLLDHHLAEFVFSIPGKDHLDPEKNKPVLVKAIQDLVPQEILERRKTGFELPLQEWLTGSLKERASDIFSSTLATQVFSTPFLGSMLDGIQKSQNVNLHTWASLNLLEWMSLNECKL